MTLSSERRDWRLALIAVNLAVPEILSLPLGLIAGPVRVALFLVALAALLGLNARLAAIPAARPWAVLCALLALVSGLALGILGWPRALPYLPLLLAYTPEV